MTDVFKAFELMHIQDGTMKDTYNLTDRELQIVELLEQRKSKEEITDTLCITFTTLNYCIDNIDRKYKGTTT